MLKSSSAVVFTFAALLAASPLGHTQTNPDPHHPEQGADLVPSSQSEQAMPMMNMMGGMMKMMSGMMKMMGDDQMDMSGINMSGMGMTERVEGRIAFLRAELKIADSQSQTWNAFAEVLRSNAKRLKEANMPIEANTAIPEVLARLDSQERMLTARLDGVRAMKATFVPLYESLSIEQRKAADELLGSHMGLMPTGGMMQSPMQ